MPYQLLKKFKLTDELEQFKATLFPFSIVKTNKGACQFEHKLICKNEMTIQYLECRNKPCSEKNGCTKKYKIHSCGKSSKSVIFEQGEHSTTKMVRSHYGESEYLYIYFMI